MESADLTYADECLDAFEASHLLDDLASLLNWQRDTGQQTDKSRLHIVPMGDTGFGDDV